MPLYEYLCDSCGCRFEVLRKFSEADAPTACPQCRIPGARRLLSMFAAVSRAGDGIATTVAGGSSCASCATTSCAGCKR